MRGSLGPKIRLTVEESNDIRYQEIFAVKLQQKVILDLEPFKPQGLTEVPT